MFALIVEDNGGYNPFGYNIWNGFSQTNNDELQKVEVKAVFSTPSIRMDGFKNNEKTIRATKRINEILAENNESQHNFIIVSASKLSEMVSNYK